MEETIGQIDRLALAGYMWLSTTLRLLRLSDATGYVVFFMGIALAGFIWIAVNGSVKQMEGRGSAAWEMVKFGLCAFAGFLLFYGTVKDVSALFANSSTKTRAAANSNNAAAFLPGYLVERYFTAPLVDLGLAIANPANRAMFANPYESARRVVQEPDVGNDPQYNATRAVWRDVVAPALLEKSPALRDKLVSEQLMSYYYNPRSDLPTPGTFAAILPNSWTAAGRFPNTKADRVQALLVDPNNVRPADFLAVTRDLGPLMAERSSGAQAWASGNSGVVVPALSDSTLALIANGTGWAPATVPREIADPANGGSDQRVADAYAAGRRVLAAVFADSNRLPSSAPLTDAAAVYKQIGRAGDLAAAASLITDPNRVLLFGVTCQKIGETYCPIVLSGASERQLQADAAGSGDWSRRLARGVGALIAAPGAGLASFLTWLASEGVPLAIGYAKFALILLTPLGVALLFWPGRLEIAIKVLVGGFVFLGLFQFLYIVWDAVTSVTWTLSGLVFGTSAPTENELAAAVGDIGVLGVTAAQMFKLAGFGALGYLAWAFTFDAIDSAYRLTQRGSGGADMGGSRADVSRAPAIFTGAAKKGSK
jgi:hypothetical protein